MSETISYKRVFNLAWPASVASLITPLLGLTDATVLGYSERPFDVGAVGLAAAIFSLAYWTFGFLRMSTAGLTAQAIGAGDEARARRALAQAAGVGIVIGLSLVILQVPFGDLSFWLMTRGTTVETDTISAAETYYSIRIWGAPFVMVTYGALGWLTARGRTDLLMVIVVLTTFLNMGLDILFVIEFKWGAGGISLGTLIAEIFSAFVAGLAVLHVLKRHGGTDAHWHEIEYFAPRALKRLLAVNIDIFIRTFVLSASYVFFIQQSGVYGDVILSANQLLMQFFLVTGLALDGPAIAAEALVGQALGQSREEKRRQLFREAVYKSAIIAGIGAVLMASLYAIFSSSLINLTAPDILINDTVRTYFIWIILSPLVVAAAFQMDGVYIGATRSKALRNSMIVSGLAFMAGIYGLSPVFGNHGLWLAFGAFMLARTISLALAWPGFSPLIREGVQEE